MSAEFHDDHLPSDRHHDPEDRWPGFEAEEALYWARVLLRHSPGPQRAGIKAQMHTAIERGVPVTGPEWVRTAETARGDGFTPVLYQTLFETLQTISPASFRSHPGHRKTVFKTYVPGTPYESELWSDWPRLFLTEGFDARTATSLALLRAEPRFPQTQKRGDVEA
ncbi:hypothetical protein [Brevibacterium renqingii]|uniref:hypothetical protein n=1 Tax=Brevibacterium renqingii TaxID=2776916 RepID=UPI001ADFF923|nr:hypothetical protein [Brevibacterium renqingii]